MQPGQAEVQNLYLPLAVDHHVRRLEVAVDEKMLVGVLETLRRLPNHLAGQPPGNLLVLLDELVEVDAVDVLHHQVEYALLAVGFVSPHNVGMIEPAGEFDLHREPADVVLVEVGRQDFDRPVLLEQFVPGFVDDAHPAPAAGFENFVRPDPHRTIDETALPGGVGRSFFLGGSFVFAVIAGRPVGLPADMDHQVRHGLGMFGKPPGVFLRRERIPRLGPVIQFQAEQFFQKRPLVIFGQLAEVGFDLGRLAGFEEFFELFADAVDAHVEQHLGRGGDGGSRVVPVAAHSESSGTLGGPNVSVSTDPSSLAHLSRIKRILRSTVRGTQSSFSAISSFV